MPKQIVIAEQHRIAAVFSEDQIQELIVATGSHQVGDIFLGTVENILPGIDAAFVNIGDSDKNGFMHVSDLGPLKLKRTAGPITELLAPQQKVLVQIMKEPTGNKGPRLTGKVTLPGRYLVLMPYSKGVNLSRRIRNEAERNRLRALGILIKPSGMGLLVRTEAEGVSEEAIIEDLEALQRSWENIQEEALTTRPPALLNRDDDFIQRVLRDVYSDDVNRIVTDTASGLERTRKHLSNWSAGRIPSGLLVDYHREPTHILEYFRVNAAIREALKPRVDLPSGGYIIIEPTEALTVIDVNSGSFTRSATARETVLWTNCEAAVEIARQLRLRNIAGVIVVDFIDMDSRRDQMQVLEQFGAALRADKSRPQISQLSELGLVELTRKRQGQNIYELFGRPCPTCNGLGHLAHLPGSESTVPLSVVTAFPSSYSPPTQSFYGRPSIREDRTVSLSPHPELQELDLLNHPNYQEKNGKSSRRRRRRGTESPSLRSGQSAAPVAIDRSSDERSTPGRGRAASRQTDDRSIEEVKEEKAAPLEASSARSKRSRSNRRKADESPEVIAIEMPPTEQRIYAMMGISPLVYADKADDVNSSVLVSVVLPGEAAQFTPPVGMKSASADTGLSQLDEDSSAARQAQDGNGSDSSPKDPKEVNASKGEGHQATAVSGSNRPALKFKTPALEDSQEVSAESGSENTSTKSSPVRRRRRSGSHQKSRTAIAEAAKVTGNSSAPSTSAASSPTLASGTDPQKSEQQDAGSSKEAEAEKVMRRRRRRRSSAS